MAGDDQGELIQSPWRPMRALCDLLDSDRRLPRQRSQHRANQGPSPPAAHLAEFNFILRINCARSGAENAHVEIPVCTVLYGSIFGSVLRAQKLRHNSSPTCAECAHPFRYIPSALSFSSRSWLCEKAPEDLPDGPKQGAGQISAPRRIFRGWISVRGQRIFRHWRASKVGSLPRSCESHQQVRLGHSQGSAQHQACTKRAPVAHAPLCRFQHSVLNSTLCAGMGPCTQLGTHERCASH